MNRKRKISFYLSLPAGVFVVSLSIYGSILLHARPELPANIKAENLIRVDGIRIEHAKDIEFALIHKNIGDWAAFEVRKDGKIETLRAQLIAYYSTVSFPLIYLFIGFFCFFIGFIVFILKREDQKARLLYWLALVFGFLLIVDGGTYCLRRQWPSYLPAVLFYLFYPLAPALLLRFSLAFSSTKVHFRTALIYGLAGIFSAALVATTLWSTLTSSVAIFRLYRSIFYVFRFYVIVFLLLAIIHFVYIYKKTVLVENKAQIKWIFLGLIFGLGPFIFIYQMPTILGMKPLLTEDFASVFFIFIPLGFALSIFKFKLLDVELVINRSLVYSLLTIFTVSVYLFSVRVFQNLFSRILTVSETSISLGSALLAAVVFHPARKKIQEFVDKSFFRQAYDYKKVTLKFSEAAQKALSLDELSDIFLANLEKAIPLEEASLSVYSAGPSENRLLVSRGSKGEKCPPLVFPAPSAEVWARRGATNTEEGIDFSQDRGLAEKKLEMVLPFRTASLNGCVALGRKKSGEKFTRDDIDLLVSLGGELALNLDRIRLQEEVIYERASKEKLDELNRLKTEFLSTVSHELRTPLGSIQGLTELLQEGKIKDKTKREELLSIVACESGRLSRLIHNILDFGKIEQQAKTYHLHKTEAGPLIEEAVGVFRLQLEAGGFTLRLALPQKPVFLDIDGDAVKQVLINLIDNAIKYSSVNKEIEISLLEEEQEAEIQVKDKGIGIPLEDQEKIFGGFYRAAEAREINPKGVGLGLKIAAHIMAAHKGEMKVKSEPGRGSTFRLIFFRS
jgi:signal transduction histidine kinase